MILLGFSCLTIQKQSWPNEKCHGGVKRMNKTRLLNPGKLKICGIIVFHILLTAACFTNAFANPGILFGGVSLAGAEFGDHHLPGSYGVDYTYPTQAEVDYFMGKGMNVFRIPVRWERLQHAPSNTLESAELARLDEIVNYATSKGAYIILDPHNYARYYGDIIGESDVPETAFAQFWSALANHYKGNPRAIFGLMNEPHTMLTELWRQDANVAIAAIRSTGAANLILVPGNAWTGAHSWYQTWYGIPNSIEMLKITDPCNNYAFEVHQYMDSNFSGHSDVCVSETIGAEKLEDFTNWLREHGKRGFLGEFAGGRNSTCYAALDNMLSYIDDHADVWLGWAYWAAGPWWGEYKFTLEPINGEDRPQMAPLSKHLPVKRNIPIGAIQLNLLQN